MSVIKFKSNRVRRNYSGGLELDRLQQKHPATDSNRPEEWIASVVTATNDGLPDIKDEGLSITENGQSFDEVIQEKPEKLLGEQHIAKHGTSLGFLVKLIDSSMRLHTQVHPTRAFAKKNLGSNWGKFEAYYVLKIRERDEGYIRLGFQNAPTKEEWKRIVETQDIEAMDACFEKVPIKQGDIIYIPGGVPHAIGEDVFLVEILEPSDLVVRCEFERDGIVLPEEGRFMGKDLDFCLDVFDYTEYSVEDIQNQFFLKREQVLAEENLSIQQLISSEIAPTFEVYSFEVSKSYTLALDKRFLVGINLGEAVEISSNDTPIVVEQGESFFISSYLKAITIRSTNNKTAELCVVTNIL